jgi:Peptidase family M28
MEIIRELCSFEGRLAGTDAERRAANRAAERLRELGRKAEVEPTYVHPQYGLVHALHCLLGFAGSLVAIELPELGFGLVLAAATSMYLDLNYRLYLVRSLFFRRASQNVVSRGGRADAPGRLIVCAHVDAGHSGAVYTPKRARRAARLRQRFPWLGPFRLLFWSLAALLPLLGARMAGIDSDAISVLQLPSTLILLLGIFALVEIELSPVVPGANDNASGVATALSIAQELEAEPPENLDVWFVLDGG